jgi:hypothetical protein
LDLLHHRLRPLQRRRIWQPHIDQQIALVLRRDEAGRHAREAEVRQVKQSAIDGQHYHADTQQSFHDQAVVVGRVFEAQVEKLEEPAEHQIEHKRQRIALLVFWL